MVAETNPKIFFSDLSISAATAFAQLHTATLGRELARDVSHLNGSYSKKNVKGKLHWYFAYRESSHRVRQLYVGPDTTDVRSLVEKASSANPQEQTKPLAKAAFAMGLAAVSRQHLSVISRINEYEFFRAGGVLIGTHAFLSYANMLGIRWQSTEQTVDIDFAHAGKNISIALPANIKATPHAAISTMAEGFLPMVQYRGSAGATYRHPEQAEFQIDFLCPQTANEATPIKVDNLDVALQPLRFMEFSLEAPQQTTLLDNTGRSVVVTVPAPERYAIHKLLIIGERTGAFRAKISKDLMQSASLISYFAERDPDAIKQAWRDAYNRGPGWVRRLTQGALALKRIDADLGRWVAGAA